MPFEKGTMASEMEVDNRSQKRRLFRYLLFFPRCIHIGHVLMRVHDCLDCVISFKKANDLVI